MPRFDLARGDAAIAFANEFDTDPSLRPANQNFDQIVQSLINKANDLEVLVEGKVNINEIKSQIAIGSELIKIQATEVVVVGGFTVVDINNEQSGNTSGDVPISITRIVGDVVQTGAIQSVGFGPSEGTEIDLDNETMTFGGSSSPALFYDGAGNLTITGTLEAGSIIANSATVDGVTMGTISSRAESGFDIQQQLEVTGTTVLLGVMEPENTGGFKAGDITWSPTTGALTGGSGIAITEFGIIGAESGVATFTILASDGSSTWAGDITTSGSIFTDGSTSDGGLFGCIVANPASASVNGFRSTTTAGNAAANFENSGGGSAVVATKAAGSTGSTAAFTGISVVSGNPALSLINTAGGNAATFSSPKIGGDVNFLDDVDIDLTLVVGGIASFDDTTQASSTVTGGGQFAGGVGIVKNLHVGGTFTLTGVSTFTGAATFNNDVNIANNSELDVDRNVFLASDGQSGASSVIIGGNTGVTGKNTLIFKEGTAGSLVANEWHLYGALSSDAKTTLGFVSEQTVAAIGTFTPSHKLKIVHNAVEYEIQLDAV